VQYGVFYYARDARGRLSNVTCGDNLTLAYYANNLMYDAQGRMTSAYFADDGLVAKWGYHPQTQELTLIKYSVNGLPQTQVAYGSHDKNGNIGSEVRAVRVNGTWTPVVKPYTYDGFDRLKTGPDGSLSDTYEYTPGGDITRGGSYYDPTNGATYESYGYNNASLAHAATSILPKKYAFAIRDLAYDNAGRLRTSTLQTSPAQQTVYKFNAGDCLRRMAFTHPGHGSQLHLRPVV